jgi:hypothetical protein
MKWNAEGSVEPRDVSRETDTGLEEGGERKEERSTLIYNVLITISIIQ